MASSRSSILGNEQLSKAQTIDLIVSYSSSSTPNPQADSFLELSQNTDNNPELLRRFLAAWGQGRLRRITSGQPGPVTAAQEAAALDSNAAGFLRLMEFPSLYISRQHRDLYNAGYIKAVVQHSELVDYIKEVCKGQTVGVVRHCGVPHTRAVATTHPCPSTLKPPAQPPPDALKTNNWLPTQIPRTPGGNNLRHCAPCTPPLVC
jgi:hypothetical protein